MEYDLVYSERFNEFFLFLFIFTIEYENTIIYKKEIRVLECKKIKNSTYKGKKNYLCILYKDNMNKRINPIYG